MSHLLLCVLVASAPLLASGCAPLPRPHCEPEWSYFEKTHSCYKVLDKTEAKNTYEACKAVKSIATSIHTEEENIFVAELARKLTTTVDYFGIGLQRIPFATSSSNKTDVAWVDSTYVDYFPRYPYDNHYEFLTIIADKASNNEWYDVPEYIPVLPICKTSARK